MIHSFFCTRSLSILLFYILYIDSFTKMQPKNKFHQQHQPQRERGRERTILSPLTAICLLTMLKNIKLFSDVWLLFFFVCSAFLFQCTTHFAFQRYRFAVDVLLFGTHQKLPFTEDFFFSFIVRSIVQWKGRHAFFPIFYIFPYARCVASDKVICMVHMNCEHCLFRCRIHCDVCVCVEWGR